MNPKIGLGVALVLLLGIGGCGETDKPTPGPAADMGAVEEYTPLMGSLTARQMQLWSNSCALCHATGVAGAPIAGNAEQWQVRSAQGKDVLLAHTLEGFNSMPPLGYCMSCETEDFIAMIQFMTGDLQ